LPAGKDIEVLHQWW